MQQVELSHKIRSKYNLINAIVFQQKPHFIWSVRLVYGLAEISLSMLQESITGLSYVVTKVAIVINPSNPFSL